MTRHNPRTHKSVLLIAHTSFNQPNEIWEDRSPSAIAGVIDEIIFQSSTKKNNQLVILKDHMNI
jgi:hypothetical protein